MPELGQRVRLRSGRGRWRENFRAISLPYTDEGIGVVIRIAEEKEYRDAVREGRHVFGIPWPAHQIEVLSSSKNAEQETQELPQNQKKSPEVEVLGIDAVQVIVRENRRAQNQGWFLKMQY